MINSETREMLDDFRKRMKIINIVKHFTDKKMPDDIRELFGGNTDMIDNIVVMTLIYIMDHTLRYDEKCEMDDIVGFIGDVSEYYSFDESKANRIADYIVTDVLQNSGKIRMFDTFNEKESTFSSVTSRIITEDNRNYRLTEDAYDFLFRTKEIDSELDFSVNRFRLNEFIKRGNYSKALKESCELVTRVRGLKTRMDDFILRCKTDISTVSIDEYEDIMKQVKDAFEDEHRQLNDIRKIVSSKLDLLVDAIQNGNTVKNAGQTEKEIKEILKNINVVIDEQSKLYNKKFEFGECYGRMLDDDFSYFSVGRFDITKNIIQPSQLLNNEDGAELYRLFIPLMKPRFNKLFSIENFYAKQKKLSDKEETDIIDIDGAEYSGEQADEERNRRFAFVIKSLFSFFSNENSVGKNNIKFSGYISSLSTEDKKYISEENALFNVILKLYGMGTLDIKGWREQESIINPPVGEFDLAWCLSELPEELTAMDIIKISRCDNTFEVLIENGIKITINDFDIEVL